MDYAQLTEWARWFNGIAGAVAWTWLTVRTFIRRKDYPLVVWTVLLTLSFFAGATAEGSIEAALQGAPAGVRTFLATLAVVSLLWTLFITQPKWDVSVAHREGRSRI